MDVGREHVGRQHTREMMGELSEHNIWGYSMVKRNGLDTGMIEK